MDRPRKKTRVAYEYRECRDYLQEKYHYQERDVLGYKHALKSGASEMPPCQDFWRWVCDHHQIHNGCYVTFSAERLAEIEEDWVKKIYALYLGEFADEDGTLRMWCEW